MKALIINLETDQMLVFDVLSRRQTLTNDEEPVYNTILKKLKAAGRTYNWYVDYFNQLEKTSGKRFSTEDAMFYGMVLTTMR